MYAGVIDRPTGLDECGLWWIIIIIIIISGVRLSLLVLRPLLAYCTSPRWQVMVTAEKLVEWRLAGETEVLGRNPAPAPHCPPQIPHD
jgi:hypothetical protein